MADNPTTGLPRLTLEQRKAAAGQFERANQVLAGEKNQDYGIQLLINCCQIDPANLVYRQTLRKAVKAKYDNNLRGSRFAFLSTMTTKLKIRSAVKAEDWLKILELGEQVLLSNPWDVGAQLAMGEAFTALGLLDHAVWILEQARQKDPKDATVNRALAIVYEKRGNFNQAMNLWEMVRTAVPTDIEAQHKAKDLAASATIARGKYAEAIQAHLNEKDEPAGPAQPAVIAKQAMSPVEERCAREAAPLLAKIKSDPANVTAYVNLVAVYRRADHIDQARALLQQGLAAAGNDFELAIALADLDIEPFRRDLAVTEQKLGKNPQDAQLGKIRGKLLKEIHTRELALFQQKAERFPTEMAHRFELGIRLMKVGQLDEAIKELQNARGDPRFFARALVYLGYCFKQRNNWRLAQRNFEEALRNLTPGDEALKKEIMFQIAHGCAEANDLPRAVEMAYELANIDFAYKDIGKLLEEWQIKLQNA